MTLALSCDRRHEILFRCSFFQRTIPEIPFLGVLLLCDLFLTEWFRGIESILVLWYSSLFLMSNVVFLFFASFHQVRTQETSRTPRVFPHVPFSLPNWKCSMFFYPHYFFSTSCPTFLSHVPSRFLSFVSPGKKKFSIRSPSCRSPSSKTVLLEQELSCQWIWITGCNREWGNWLSVRCTFVFVELCSTTKNETKRSKFFLSGSERTRRKTPKLFFLAMRWGYESWVSRVTEDRTVLGDPRSFLSLFIPHIHDTRDMIGSLHPGCMEDGKREKSGWSQSCESGKVREVTTWNTCTDPHARQGTGHF